MPNGIDSIRSFYQSGGRLRREAVVAGLALLVGLLIMPLLIWVAGRLSLGSYANGSVFALLKDFAGGLAAGELAYWIVLFGPYALLLIIRTSRALAR